MTKSSFLSVILALLFLPVVAQPPIPEEEWEEYEDIYVFMRIDRIGAYEIGAIFSYETERLYLPVMDLFRVLQINMDLSPRNDVVTGFFLDENNRYRIDHPNKEIEIDNRTISLRDEDILYTLSGVYLYVGLFGPAFGLHTQFNFRSMSVVLRTDLELPAIREMRLKQMRQNIERLRGEVEVDTTLQRQYHLFKAGMADWAVFATQQNGAVDDARLSLALGTEFLAGETNLVLNYSSRDGFNERRQQYQWRWVNNQTRAIKQIRAGKLSASSISSLYAPMIGISATNSPSTFRRSFGEYTLTDFTEPGWTVELYVNNVLVDYVTADASGFFQFDVPMIYGSTEVTMKFYGPYGEERTRQQFMNIPYNFIPQGELEYNVFGGMAQDLTNTLFSRAEAFYGLTRSLTLGGGYEYLSNNPRAGQRAPAENGEDAQPLHIPFVSAAANLFGMMLISGEYAHNVRSKALLSIRLPSNLVLDLNYSIFEEGQQAIRFSYLEERQVGLSVPMQIGRFRMQSRLGFKQNVYEQFSYNTANVLFSTAIGRVSTTLSGFASWIDSRTPYVSANLSMGVRLPYGFTLRPQAQFDVSNASIISLKADVEKRITRMGFLSLGYDENVRMGIRSVNLNFRYDLPFVQAGISTRADSRMVTSSQSLRGSMAFGSGNKHLHTDNRSMTGRGGLTIVPFVDVNHNGIRDEGEPLATGLNVRLNGGRTLKDINDTLIRIVELEPYTHYLMQLDESSLENIAWRLSHKTKNVYIDPNQFKRVEVPVLPMGEVSGTVYLLREGRQRGLGRVLINIYHSDGQLFTQNMSEPDGYFVNMELPPGSYYAAPDAAQLRRMGMETRDERIDFEVLPDILGDIVFGIDFVLYPSDETPSDTQAATLPEETRPAEPAPTAPAQVQPTPSVEPTAPQPLSPQPTAPITPQPTTPAPTTAEPVPTAPTMPQPATPEPSTPRVAETPVAPESKPEAPKTVTIQEETRPTEPAPTDPAQAQPTPSVEPTAPRPLSPQPTEPITPQPTTPEPRTPEPTTLQPDVSDPASDQEALRQALERRLNSALRLFIQAQEAAMARDFRRSMLLVDQSLSLYVTGQALALKGSIYYLTGDLRAAMEYWLQARELIPDLAIPEIDASPPSINRE